MQLKKPPCDTYTVRGKTVALHRMNTLLFTILQPLKLLYTSTFKACFTMQSVSSNILLKTCPSVLFRAMLHSFYQQICFSLHSVFIICFHTALCKHRSLAEKTLNSSHQMSHFYLLYTLWCNTMKQSDFDEISCF